MRAPRLLLEGPPGVGKTTLVLGVVSALRRAGLPVAGFTTRERRRQGRRVGFMVEAMDGSSALIAHVDFRDGPTVGRYHVDVPAFERVALPAMAAAREGRATVVIDEIGRMELASAAFVAALHELLDDDLPLLATIHVHRDRLTDALKARPDVERFHLTPGNRNELGATLTARLAASARDAGLARSPAPPTARSPRPAP